MPRFGGGPGTNWVQAAPPDVTERRPTSLHVLARHWPSRPPGPGRRSPRRATSANAARSKQHMPSPGRQASGMASHENYCGWVGWTGCGIPSTSPRATTRRPGGRATRRHHRSRRGLPPGRRVVGLRQADGMPHQSQRARSSHSSKGITTFGQPPREPGAGVRIGHN